MLQFCFFLTGAQFNDLWRYRVSDGMWTWIHGVNTTGSGGVRGTKGVADPANMPNARILATPFNVKEEELWILCGTNVGTLQTCRTRCSSPNKFPFHVAGAPQQDLWRFRINDTTWTFMNGTSSSFVIGVYGTMGVPDPGNYPSSRTWTTGFYDPFEHALWAHAGFCKSTTGAHLSIASTEAPSANYLLLLFFSQEMDGAVKFGGIVSTKELGLGCMVTHQETMDPTMVPKGSPAQRTPQALVEAMLDFLIPTHGSIGSTLVWRMPTCGASL
jgi:hypothetical protein